MKSLLLKLEKKYPLLYEIFKFLLVGGLATILDMLTMALILYFASPSIYNYNFINTIIGNASPNDLIAVLATGTGFIAGLVFNYIFSILFVFSSTNTDFAKTKKGFFAFSLLSLIGFFIHTLGMLIGYGYLKINEWIIKIFLTFVVLIFNYITRKKIIFKTKREKN